MSPKLRQNHGPAGSQILALGAARGERLVPNDDIVGPIDSSDEWIQQRTGIRSRTYAGDDVTSIDLAEAAGREAIERSGVPLSEIDAIIVASITIVRLSPSSSAVVAGRLGLTPAAAFDLNAACAGYAYGIAQADAMIRSGAARHVLVIGAEKLSEIIDPTDRSISFILGDGAGAALLGPTEDPGVSRSILGSDGTRWEAVSMNRSLQEERREGGASATLRQDGPSVYRWAVSEVSKVASEILEASGVEASDIAAFIPHQANLRIINELARKVGLPESTIIAHDIVETGNTSAASIPLAAHRLLEEHPELSGKLALQIGFGAGLVYGGQVVRLP